MYLPFVYVFNLCGGFYLGPKKYNYVFGVTCLKKLGWVGFFFLTFFSAIFLLYQERMEHLSKI